MQHSTKTSSSLKDNIFQGLSKIFHEIFGVVFCGLSEGHSFYKDSLYQPLSVKSLYLTVLSEFKIGYCLFYYFSALLQHSQLVRLSFILENIHRSALHGQTNKNKNYLGKKIIN